MAKKVPGNNGLVRHNGFKHILLPVFYGPVVNRPDFRSKVGSSAIYKTTKVCQ